MEHLKSTIITYRRKMEKVGNINRLPAQSIRKIVSIHNAYLSPNALQLLTKSIVSLYASKGLDG